MPDDLNDLGDFTAPHPAWVHGLLAAPGPIAFALAAVVLAPLTLTLVGRPWLGLVVLAGAATYWWAIMWVGRQVSAPPVAAILPAFLLLALFLAWPMAAGLKFFTQFPFGSAAPAARWSTLPLDREWSVLATQKLIIVMLLAAPLYHSIWLRRWTVLWFRFALLAGVGGLLAVAAMQIKPDASNDDHVAAALAAAMCWLAGLMLSSARRWRLERRGHQAGDWAASLRGPHFAMMLLSGAVLLAAGGMALACLFGPVPWRQMASWVGLGAGLMLALLARGRTFRVLGWLLLAAGLAAVWNLGPRELIVQSFTRGRLLGWSGWDVSVDDRSGWLWIMQTRGLAGLAVLAAAMLLAGGWQLRSFLRVGEAAERLACGGALVGSWLMAAGWLLGPGHVSGAGALLALAMWGLSLGPMRNGISDCGLRIADLNEDGRQIANPNSEIRNPKFGMGNRPSGFSGYLLCLMVLVVFCYGMIGEVTIAHPRMWLAISGHGSDKVLHAIWGLYVTLVCCVAAAPLGRWPAVLAGAGLANGLSVLSEYVQKWYLPNRQFDLWDPAAFAVGAALVVAGLLLVPYRWPSWHRRETVGAQG